MPVLQKVHSAQSVQQSQSLSGNIPQKPSQTACVDSALFLCLVGISSWAVMFLFYSLVVDAVITAQEGSFANVARVDASDSNTFLNATLNEAYEAATFASILFQEYNDGFFDVAVLGWESTVWATAGVLAKSLSYYHSLSSLVAVSGDGTIVVVAHAPKSSSHPLLGDFSIHVVDASNVSDPAMFVGEFSGSGGAAALVPAAWNSSSIDSPLTSIAFSAHPAILSILQRSPSADNDLLHFGQAWHVAETPLVLFEDHNAPVVTYAVNVSTKCASNCNASSSHFVHPAPAKPVTVMAELDVSVLQAQLVKWVSKYSAFVGLPVDFEYSLNGEVVAAVTQLNATGTESWSELYTQYNHLTNASRMSGQGTIPTICSAGYGEDMHVGAASSAWNVSLAFMDVSKNYTSAWGAARLVPDSILANYYALSARNIARLARPSVSWASIEPPANGSTDDDASVPFAANVTTHPPITTQNSSSPPAPRTRVDWEFQLPCYDPRATVKLAMSAESM